MESLAVHFPAPLVVIVEDNDLDYEMVLKALTSLQFPYAIERCHDGEEALTFLAALRQRSSRENALGTFAIILLDLNLPGTDGKEVLQKLKADEWFKSIPVTVWSTSGHPRDIQECYQAGANSYLQKPNDFWTLVQMIQHWKEYWLETIKLPHWSGHA